MSVTFEIGCLDCRKKLWVGQGSRIYFGDDYLLRLSEFFIEHMGHSLKVVNEHMSDLDDFKEVWDHENSEQLRIIASLAERIDAVGCDSVETAAPAAPTSNLESLLRAAFIAGASYADGVDERGLEAMWQMRKGDLLPVPASSECICPTCGLRHGGSNLDGGF